MSPSGGHMGNKQVNEGPGEKKVEEENWLASCSESLSGFWLYCEVRSRQKEGGAAIRAPIVMVSLCHFV